MAHTTLITVVAILMAGVTFGRSSFPDILMEREETNEIQSNPLIPSGRILLTGPVDVPGKVPCQFDIVKTEKISGKCEKLGSEHICVAGRYALPFHQDCIFAS